MYAQQSRFTALTPDIIESDAIVRLSRQGGSVTTQTVLANSTIQFGQYRGQTFAWLLLNAMGYAVQFAVSYDVETSQASAMQNNSPLGINKGKLYDYISSFDAVTDAIKFMHVLEAARSRAAQSGNEGYILLGFGIYKNMSWQDIFFSKAKEHAKYIQNFILPKKNCFKGSAMDKFREYCLRMNALQERRPFEPKLTVVPNLSAAKGIKYYYN